MEITTKSTRKTFVFNAAWYEIIQNCSTQVKGEVFASVMEYALNGSLPTDICNEAFVIFSFIKLEIDRREKHRTQRIKPQQPEVSSEQVVVPELPAPDATPIPIVSSSNSSGTEVVSRQMRRKMERDQKKRERKMKVAC